MPPIIRVDDLHFSYNPDSEQPIPALAGVTLHVERGEYVVILGHNGSGKSTLARHLNGLLLPAAGNVWVGDWNTKDAAHLRAIRATVGMVFQTPDNQIVATIVEEDVAFGPENLGIPHAEMVTRVDRALELVEMSEYRKRAPHQLSGGQKQRVCIAGVLAMDPDVLVLDEATAMLDPAGRGEVREVVRRLHREEGTTVVAITHYMEEAVDADRVLVMEAGRIVLAGTPREVFGQAERLRSLHMELPQITQLAAALHARHPAFPADVLTVDEFVAAFAGLHPANASAPQANHRVPLPDVAAPSDDASGGDAVIEFCDVAHNYMDGTPLAVRAIEHVTLTVRRGEILGLIGHTGSGKSTVIQHCNALLRPHEGTVRIFGQEAVAPNVDVRAIRRRVGLVFQQPEAQLFEKYVGDDIAFGPRTLNLSREEVRERVRRAMATVGLGFEEFKDRMTFGLSGGQMRRVAVAGVLAMESEVLVLDEPTAGLDPRGRRELLGQILQLHREHGVTLVLVSHNMEELAALCDRICVVAHGTVIDVDTPQRIFADVSGLHAMGLGAPPVTEALHRLAEAGIGNFPLVALTVAEATVSLDLALASDAYDFHSGRGQEG